MKKLFSLLLIVMSLTSMAQVYDPSLSTVSNKPYGMAQAGPTDARSYFYDADNFVYRAYVDTAEVKSYLSLPKYRTGQFDIVVNTGGTLGLNGVITGGTNAIWYFKDGTDDDDLVQKGGGISSVAWGDITGTITLQTDLNNALAAKVPTTRSLTINGVAQDLSANRTWTIPTIQSIESGSGLTAVNDSTLKLGGNLTATETIGNSTQDFGVVITRSGASSGSTLNLISQTGIGLTISSGTGTGMTITSTSGVPALFATNPSSTNTIVEVSRFRRNTSATAAAGIGGFNKYTLETSDGTEKDAMQMNWRYTTATTGTQASAYDLILARGDNNALASTTPQLTILGTGKITASDYGDGLFTGTVTKWAAFTGTGDLVEVDPPTGGSSSASDLTSGTLSDARLSTNVPLKNGANVFTSTNDFGAITATSITLGTVSNTEFSYLDGVSSAIQTQIDAKAPTASPTFTGTVVLPSATSIGSVTNTEIGYLSGVTSAIQTQINGKVTSSRQITVYGADVPTYDISADRTYYPKSVFQQAIEAMGSVIKGQSVGVNMDQMSTTSFTAVDGTAYWTAVWLPSPQTLTGIKYWLGTTGSFTGDNFNGFALYSYSSATGTATQVATSANDETIWKGTGNSYQTIPFTGTYSASAGLYFVAFIFNASATTTAPTFGISASVATGGMQSGDFPNSGKLNSTQTLQTTLPASKAMSALTVTTLRPWIGLY